MKWDKSKPENNYNRIFAKNVFILNSNFHHNVIIPPQTRPRFPRNNSRAKTGLLELLNCALLYRVLVRGKIAAATKVGANRNIGNDKIRNIWIQRNLVGCVAL